MTSPGKDPVIISSKENIHYEENLRIFTVTYNVGAQLPNLDDVKSLFSQNTTSDCRELDVVAVGFQEIQATPVNWLVDAFYGESWADGLLFYLQNQDFVRIKYNRLLTMSLSIFVKRKHATSLRQIRKSQIKTGFGGFWGNKGGISVRFRLYGYTFCFVNCHLAPHDNMLRSRLDDFVTISDGIVFDISSQRRIIDHDYVFWLGDLNFRLDSTVTTTEIIDQLNIKNFQHLLEKDELTVTLMASPSLLVGYQECPITFPPTYKFITGTPNYDEARRPAWTDRVLYRTGLRDGGRKFPSVNCHGYQSLQGIMTSDHRPVICHFAAKVKSIALSPGKVSFPDIRKWETGCPAQVYYVFTDVQHSESDWIGIYKNNFGCLEKYISFVYALPPKVGESMGFIEYPEELIPSPGLYQLVYFGDEGKSVYGISDPFEIRGGGFSLAWQSITIGFGILVVGLANLKLGSWKE